MEVGELTGWWKTGRNLSCALFLYLNEGWEKSAEISKVLIGQVKSNFCRNSRGYFKKILCRMADNKTKDRRFILVTILSRVFVTDKP